MSVSFGSRFLCFVVVLVLVVHTARAMSVELGKPANDEMLQKHNNNNNSSSKQQQQTNHVHSGTNKIKHASRVLGSTRDQIKSKDGTRHQNHVVGDHQPTQHLAPASASGHHHVAEDKSFTIGDLIGKSRLDVHRALQEVRSVDPFSAGRNVPHQMHSRRYKLMELDLEMNHDEATTFLSAIETACHSESSGCDNGFAGLRPHGMRDKITNLASVLRSAYIQLLTASGTSKEKVMFMSDVIVIERLLHIVRSASSAASSSTLSTASAVQVLEKQCTCSGEELKKSRDPVALWHTQDDSTESDSKDWKIRVFLSCCLSQDEVTTLLKGLFRQGPTPDPKAGAMCECTSASTSTGASTKSASIKSTSVDVDGTGEITVHPPGLRADSPI